jgi:hypothetical protein
MRNEKIWRYYVHAAIGVSVDWCGTRLQLLWPEPATVKEVRSSAKQSPRGGIKWAGCLVVFLVAAMHCSATMRLGVRRESTGAATPADRRASMFAASGMVIILQTAGVQVMPLVYTGGFVRDDSAELFFAECCSMASLPYSFWYTQGTGASSLCRC